MVSNKNYSKNKSNYGGFTIYKLVNPNGAFYVGATTNLEHRLRAYQLDPLKNYKNQKNLVKSMEKYSFSQHNLEILYEHTGDFELDYMSRIEQKYIKENYFQNPLKSMNAIIEGVSKEEALREKDI